MTTDSGPQDPLAVDEIRLPPLIWLDDDATVRDVARTMWHARVSAVIIGPGAAIVTERDLVRAMAEGVASGALAALVASPEAVVLPNTTSVVGALATMLHAGVRHVVIVDAVGAPCAVLPLAAAAAAVLDRAAIPTWRSALRIVLRVEDADR